MRLPVSVQINLAPSDHSIAKILLERQVSLFAPCVDEVVLTLDTRPNVGRYAASWVEGKTAIEKTILEIIAKHPNCRLARVDYDPKTQTQVADFFKQKSLFPLGDYRGAPCYVYFYGLHSCRNDLVFHIDGDIVLGGTLDRWFEKAISELRDPITFATSPLPGPPSTDGHLKQLCLAEDRGERRYTLSGFSTRVFFLDRRKLAGINFDRRVTGWLRLKSLLLPYKPIKASEVVIREHMESQNLNRVDFGGPGKFYSLHPNYKSKAFLEALPAILRRLDTCDVPEQQQGDFEFSDSYYDFSAERQAALQTTVLSRTIYGCVAIGHFKVCCTGSAKSNSRWVT
jgi:hypothetical protein